MSYSHSHSNLKWIFDSMFFLQTLFLFSNVYVKIADCSEMITTRFITNFPVIYDCVCATKLRLEYFVYTRIFGRHCEPVGDSWTNVSYISYVYDLIENYQSDTQFINDPQSTTLQIIKKNDDAYWFHLPESGLQFVCIDAPSKVRFISVEYTHPNLLYPVCFEIPKSYYVVGNHLLSNTFVLRYLYYNTRNIGGTSIPPFDDRYVINIIDNNIDQFELRWGDYCVLEETTCKIQSLPRSSTESKKQC